MSRAQYYWRQADICMRLSLVSKDEAAELLITKAMTLLSQAETLLAEEAAAASRNRAGSQPCADRDGR